MRFEFGIGQGASVYSYRFETPDRLERDECIRAELTLVVPRSWPDARTLKFDVRDFEILVHNLADEGIEEETGIKFDSLSLATTNYPITVEGSVITKTALRLSTTNGPIRAHGSLKSNSFLDVSSSNAALDLHATSARVTNLRTSNGKIVGNHTALDSLQCETSNDQINLQTARAPSIELKTTNANIIASEVEIGNKLEATGSNGAVNVDIVRWFDGWSGEGVKVVAKSSNAPAKVTMVSIGEWDDIWIGRCFFGWRWGRVFVLVCLLLNWCFVCCVLKLCCFSLAFEKGCNLNYSILALFFFFSLFPFISPMTIAVPFPSPPLTIKPPSTSSPTKWKALLSPMLRISIWTSRARAESRGGRVNKRRIEGLEISMSGQRPQRRRCGFVLSKRENNK